MALISSLLDIILPNLCELCKGERTHGGVCPQCLSSFKKITGPVCTLCGLPFVTQVGSNHLCSECAKGKRPFVKARSALYYTELGAKAIRLFKYQSRFSLGPTFNRLLWGLCGEFPDTDLILPVPLHKKRLRSRGFNQSLMLARGVARRIGKGINYDSLKRTRLTKAQVELTLEERRRNVKGAFEVIRPERVKGKTVLLVDDVYTTGATLTACANELKKAGAKVNALTLARSVRSL